MRERRGQIERAAHKKQTNKMAAAESFLLVGMLEMVVVRKGLNGVEGDEWVKVGGCGSPHLAGLRGNRDDPQ